MKNALLAQNDNLAIESLKEKVGRSVFDLSHSTTFPIDVDGALLPIACIETVPSDSFEISCELLLRQLSPLKVPIMANFRLNTAWYYCDNRLAWKKFERFMTGGRSGNEVYDIPTVYNFWSNSAGLPTKFSLVDSNADSNFKQNYKNTLHTYFGISMNHDFSSGVPSYSNFPDDSNELPLAFPFFDYQIIARDMYTDIDRLPQNPKSGSAFLDYDDIDSDWAYSNLFPPDDDEIRLKDGMQDISGFQSGDDSIVTTHGFILDKVRYHNVRDDYFTTSKKAPMRGDVPSIDTQMIISSVDASKTITSDPYKDILATAGYNVSVTSNGLFASRYQQSQGNTNGDNIGTNMTTAGFDAQGTGRNQQPMYPYPETLDPNISTNVGNTALKNALEKLEFNVQSVKSINAAELRLLSQLTVWQELNMLHKPYYNDFLNAHFNGVRVGESAVEKPQFIGGTSQLISINEILQTSQSSESSPLGNQGATAMSLANNYVGKIYCNNYGYIIGIAYIITDMYYNPAMPRNFSRRTKEDFYSPEFANLSMQATLNKEIFFSNDDDWNNTPWGYTGAFDEMRSIPNKVAGDLLNSSYTDLKAWVIRREFANDNKPSMSSKFLSLKDNVDKTAWAVPTMPAFMLQCANYVKAVRPMPYVAIPKAL